MLKLIPHEMCERHAHPGVARRLVADRGDGRPVEPPRHRRHQVHSPATTSSPSSRRKPPSSRRSSATTRQETDISYDEIMEGFDEAEIEFAETTRTQRRSTSSARREDAPVVTLVQRDPAQRDQEGRLRHPRRAVREDAARALPHRRRAARGDAPAAQAQERDLSRLKIMALARHRRAPPAAGRTHQAQARQGPRDGLPRLVLADDLGREDRACACSTSATCSST